MIVNTLDLFNDYFLLRHGDYLDMLACDSDGGSVMVGRMEAEEVKERVRQEVRKVGEVREVNRDLVARRVAKEVEKYKNLQGRKLGVWKQMLHAQVQGHLEAGKVAGKRKWQAKHPVHLAVAGDKSA